MTKPTDSAANTSHLNADVLHTILPLTEAQSMAELLRAALDIIQTAFSASAGSIFFCLNHEEFAQTGKMPPEVAGFIKRQDNAVAERLRQGVWRVLEPDKLPVSEHKFAAQQTLLFNVPLLKTNQVIGSLSLVLPDNRIFSSAERKSLIYYARTIGQIAAVTAQLILAQKRYRELDMLHQMGQALISTVDITELLENVMRLSANVLNAAAASIMLVDESRQDLVFEVTHSPAREKLARQRIGLNEGIAGWVATHARPVIANEVHKDPRFNPKIDAHTGFLTNSIAAVPLQLKGKVVGVLEALNKYSEDGFDENDLRLMNSIAAQTAIALENARLYQNLTDERDKIIKAQEDVRKALSRNLHDGAVQQMSAISMNIEYVQKLLERDLTEASKELSHIQQLANEAARQARLVLFELRPVILETDGLISALERYVQQLNESEPFILTANLQAIPVTLNKTVEGTIFSIIQEAINNIKRHAQAENVYLSVEPKSSFLKVIIKDDGLGFDVSQTQAGYAARNSFGLLNMKERAELIEGQLTIESSMDSANHGTIITLLIPLKRGTGVLNQSLIIGENYG